MIDYLLLSGGVSMVVINNHNYAFSSILHIAYSVSNLNVTDGQEINKWSAREI